MVIKYGLGARMNNNLSNDKTDQNITNFADLLHLSD